MKINNLPKYFFYPQKDRIGTGLILLVIALVFAWLTLPLLWEHIEAYLLPLFFALPAIVFLLKKKFPILVLEKDRLYYNNSVLGYGRDEFLFIIFPYLYLNKNKLTEIKYNDIAEYQFIGEGKIPMRIRVGPIPITKINRKAIKEVIIKLKNGEKLFLKMKIVSDEDFSEINTIFDLQFQK